MDETILIKVDWCDEHEDLLKEWAEKGRYYAWMHNKTSVDYGRLNNLLTLPMIFISTISGSATFSLVGQQHYTLFLSTVLPLVIGTMGLTSAILSSLTKFLSTAELAEKHSMFYRQFNILVRRICLELSLPRIQRKKPFEILNVNRHEFDRLVNEAPNIPEHVVSEFNKRFPLNNNKPEIANAFDKIRIYGRSKEIKSKEILLKKLRHFYKWKMYAINNAGTDLDRKSNYIHTNNEYVKNDDDKEDTKKDDTKKDEYEYNDDDEKDEYDDDDESHIYSASRIVDIERGRNKLEKAFSQKQ
jgi:hypothetical protein